MADPKLAGGNIFAQMTTLGQTTPQPTQGADALSAMLGSLGGATQPPAPMTKTDEKRLLVDEVGRAKAIALADEETLRTFAAARENGNRLAEDPIYQELRSAPYSQILRKYGPEVANNRQRILKGEQEFGAILNDPRTEGEVYKDTGVAVGQGIWNLAGSVGALGVGLINDQAGAWTANLVQEGSEWAEGQKSTRFQEYDEANELMASLDRVDRKAEYEADLADGSMPNWVDTAEYWGKSAFDAVGRVASDPALAGDFIAENIGTLIPSTALAKGALAAAKGSQLAGKVAVPAAVALGESGSAYVGAVNRVMQMPEEQLMESSPDYARMRAGGMTHEQALTEIATDAGMMAAALQFPVAAVAGKFVRSEERR
jgi:hypothetical protein